MKSKAVFGYGVRIDKFLLIGRHNDVEMGYPEKFLNEERFPALEVRTAGDPRTGEYWLFLKNTIVETNSYYYAQLEDTKDSAGFLEGMQQFEEWKEFIGGYSAAPSMCMIVEAYYGY